MSASAAAKVRARSKPVEPATDEITCNERSREKDGHRHSCLGHGVAGPAMHFCPECRVWWWR